MMSVFRWSWRVMGLGALALTLGTPSSVLAGHHGGGGGGSGSSGGSSGGSYGSSGGSSGGSYGSSGGSSGGYYNSGSYGGSSGGSSGGYYGSHGGSSGGSSGGYYSGSYGGSSGGSSGGYYGSHGGSSGGSSGGYYHSSSYHHSSHHVTVGSSEKSTSASATLVVKVPEDAQVYLQDQKMSLTGAERRFVSPQLDSSKKYVYTVKVELERDGKTVSKTAKARVEAGKTVEVAVQFDEEKANELVANVRELAQR